MNFGKPICFRLLLAESCLHATPPDPTRRCHDCSRSLRRSFRRALGNQLHSLTARLPQSEESQNRNGCDGEEMFCHKQ